MKRYCFTCRTWVEGIDCYSMCVKDGDVLYSLEEIGWMLDEEEISQAEYDEICEGA